MTDLDELERLYEGETPLHVHEKAIKTGDHTVAITVFHSHADLFVALHNAFPTLLARLRAAEAVCNVIKSFRDNGEFFDPDTCRALDAWQKARGGEE